VKKPIFRDFGWSVFDGECWAVVGIGKSHLFRVCCSRITVIVTEKVV
jgi:hypothetical protein